MSRINTKKLIQLSLFIALLVVLDLLNIGMIRIPPVSITIMHIPVIVGAILLGPISGGILGAAFGIISMIEATFRPGSPVDMLFSPFSSPNPLLSAVMCLVPRILLGLIAGYVFLLLKRLFKERDKNAVSVIVTAVFSTACHTALVLGSLSLFFDALPFKEIFGIIIGTNGLIEIAAAAFLSVTLVIPLAKTIKR